MDKKHCWTAVALLVALLGLAPKVHAAAASSCVLGVSTTSLTEVQCAASAGVAYGIEIDSPTAKVSLSEVYAGCFDTDKLGNSNVVLTSPGTPSIPKVLAGSLDTTKQSAASITPRAFANGLSCIKSLTGITFRILFTLN